jgi:hypothetical protein
MSASSNVSLSPTQSSVIQQPTVNLTRCRSEGAIQEREPNVDGRRAASWHYFTREFTQTDVTQDDEEQQEEPLGAEDVDMINRALREPDPNNNNDVDREDTCFLFTWCERHGIPPSIPIRVSLINSY